MKFRFKIEIKNILETDCIQFCLHSLMYVHFFRKHNAPYFLVDYATKIESGTPHYKKFKET